MELPDIEDAIEILKNYDLRELTLKKNDRSLTLRSDRIQEALSVVHEQAPGRDRLEDENEAPANAATVTAPIVGVVRLTDRHGGALVEKGASVVKGQIICVIEAMKVKHEVRSIVNGRVVEIYAVDGGPVEYGQKLMDIIGEV